LGRELNDSSIPRATSLMNTDLFYIKRDPDGTPVDYAIAGDKIFAASTTGTVNVKDAPYHAKGDGILGTGSMTSGSAVFTATTPIFTSTAVDGGKLVDVSSAGAQAILVAIVISRIDSTTIVLSTPASFTLTNATMIIRGRTLTNVSTMAGSATVTSASGFTDADILHPCTIADAGRWNKVGTVVSVTSPTVATLSFTARGNVVSKQIMFGTDDTAAINAAKAAAIAAGAKRLVFPAGFYACGSFGETVSIAGVDQFGAIKLETPGLMLEGDGMDVSQLWSIGPDAGSLSSYGAILLISDNASHTTVRDLGFLGTNAFAQQPTTSAGLCDGVFIGTAGPTEDVNFYYCRFDHFWLIGLHAIGDGDIDSTVKDIDIDHCTFNYNAFDGCNPSAGRGVRFTNCDGFYNGTGLLETGGGDCFVDNSKAYYTRGTGFSIGGFGDPTVGTKDVIVNSTAEFCGSGIVVGSNVQDTIITGNILKRNYLVGCQIQNGFGTQGKRGQFKHNIVVSNGYSGLVSALGLGMSEVSGWDIESNTITDLGLTGYAQAIGVSLGDVSDCRIIRNNCKGNLSHDYVSDNASDFIFHDEQQSDCAFGSATVTYLDGNFRHLVGGGPAPTLAAQSGLGTSPTIAIHGNDLHGRIELTAGASPGGGVFAKVTFAVSYSGLPSGNTPVPFIFPLNANAASVMASVYSLNWNGTFFDLAHSGSGLTSGQQYIWGYHIGA